MTGSKMRLPKRFPAGTKFVVEGRSAGSEGMRVITRYVLLPNGKRIDLPAGHFVQCACGAVRRRRVDRAVRREEAALIAL